MCIYIYDGTFEGLLTAVFLSYKSRDAQIISTLNMENTTFLEHVYVTTCLEQADRVWNGITAQICDEFLEDVYYAYLSDIPCGNELLAYVRMGFEYGAKVRNCFHIDCVNTIMRIRNKVTFEVHRLKGLLRFTKTNSEVYVADIEPDHNVLTLLSPHFARRFASQDWIIRDLKRKTAALCSGGKWVISPLEGVSLTEINLQDDFTDLWQRYFHHITIAERKNPNLQRKFVPMRYRNHITEFTCTPQKNSH